MDGASGSFNGFQVPTSSNGTNSVGAGSDNNANGTPASNDGSNQCMVREQDRFLPIANVIRIMRKVLPAHAKISDDAKDTIQECVSEYISFITSEANERCQQEKRKTITAEDVLWAMSKLGFDNYIEPLTLFLHRYREFDGDHRGSIRREPLPVLKRTAPSINLAPLQPAAPLPLPLAMAGDAILQPPISFLHQFGVYRDDMMGGGYYFRMTLSSPHIGGAGASDGDGAGASNSHTQHPGAFDWPYAGYK